MMTTKMMTKMTEEQPAVAQPSSSRVLIHNNQHNAARINDDPRISLCASASTVPAGWCRGRHARLREVAEGWTMVVSMCVDYIVT